MHLPYVLLVCVCTDMDGNTCMTAYGEQALGHVMNCSSASLLQPNITMYPDWCFRFCAYCTVERAGYVPYGRVAPICMTCLRRANYIQNDGDSDVIDIPRLERSAGSFRCLCLLPTSDTPNVPAQILMDPQIAVHICRFLVRM